VRESDVLHTANSPCEHYDHGDYLHVVDSPVRIISTRCYQREDVAKFCELIIEYAVPEDITPAANTTSNPQGFTYNEADGVLRLIKHPGGENFQGWMRLEEDVGRLQNSHHHQPHHERQHALGPRYVNSQTPITTPRSPRRTTIRIARVEPDERVNPTDRAQRNATGRRISLVMRVVVRNAVNGAGGIRNAVRQIYREGNRQPRGA
jgi:hypothetical protein